MDYSIWFKTRSKHHFLIVPEIHVSFFSLDGSDSILWALKRRNGTADKQLVFTTTVV